MLAKIAIVLVAGVLQVATSARADDVRAAIDAANGKMLADYAAGDTKAIPQTS
jgi:hypothetical protein